MKALLVLVLLFEIFEASASHCTTPPSLITSLISLECSILSDENNIQSLTEAFFPANHRKALTVQVHFYVNRSEHPLKLGAKNATSPDHVFLWFSSSVLSFIEPRMLQGFSLNTFIAEYHYAHILIAPFFSTDEEWIRGLLGNATIWLKSYAEKRFSSIEGGVEPSSQGFSACKPDLDKDDYFNNNPKYQTNVIFFLIAVIIAVTVSTLAPALISSYYPIIRKLSQRKKKKNESFKPQHLLWALILTMDLAAALCFIFSIWHIYTFGLNWKSMYRFIYPMFIGVYILIAAIAVISTCILVARARRDNTLISIPLMLYHVCCGKYNSRWVLLFWQGLGVFVVIVSTSFSSGFSCGILLALLVDPIQVVAVLATYLSTFACILYSIAFVFKMTDDILEQQSNAELRLNSCWKLFFAILAMVLITLLIIIYGFIHATIVYISGGTSFIGILIAPIISPALGWSM